jgi:hypothetical protein
MPVGRSTHRMITICWLAALFPAAFCAAAPATARMDAEVKAAIERFLRQEGTYTIELGRLVVCTVPAAQTSIAATAPHFQNGTIFDTVYRQTYLPLREAGLIEITDGPAISEPRIVHIHRPMPAPPERITCSSARTVTVAATAKATAASPDPPPGPTQRSMALRAGRVALVRIARDQVIQLSRRYRVVEFEFSTEWDPTYLRTLAATAPRAAKENKKAIFVFDFVSNPKPDEPALHITVGEIVDAGQPFKKFRDVMEYMKFHDRRPKIIY